MLIYTLMSRLLDYPDQELADHFPELRHWVAAEPGLEAQERDALAGLLAWMAGQDLLSLQGEYVQTFDMTPEHSLHLTHHSLGDDRERGPALVELGEHYKTNGYQAKPGELPDFLPLILEYCSTLDEMQVSVFLGEAAGVLQLLATNLEKAGSPYAPLIRIIASRGHLARAA